MRRLLLFLFSGIAFCQNEKCGSEDTLVIFQGQARAKLSQPANLAQLRLLVVGPGPLEYLHQDLPYWTSSPTAVSSDRVQHLISDFLPYIDWYNSYPGELFDEERYVKEYFRSEYGAELHHKTGDKDEFVSASHTVRFKDMSQLRIFLESLSSIPYVYLLEVIWELTEESRDELKNKVKEMAVAELHAAAHNYARSLGLDTIRDMIFTEGFCSEVGTFEGKVHEWKFKGDARIERIPQVEMALIVSGDIELL